MAPVHPAIVTRTERYFREYRRHIASFSEKAELEKFKTLGRILVDRKKIKRESVSKIRDLIFSIVDEKFKANLVLRDDPIKVSSKLSSNFDPVITSIAYLSTCKVCIDDSYTVDALQVNVQSAKISKDKIKYQEAPTGIQINFHAIARLEERLIEQNAFEGIAANMENLIKYFCLFVAVNELLCNSGRVVIPHGEHLLFGNMDLLKITKNEEGLFKFIDFTKNGGRLDLGAFVDKMVGMQIKTAVDYGSLGPEQDFIRDVVRAFADSNLDDINTVFEGLFLCDMTETKIGDVRAATNRLKENFYPITQLDEWSIVFNNKVDFKG